MSVDYAKRVSEFQYLDNAVPVTARLALDKKGKATFLSAFSEVIPWIETESVVIDALGERVNDAVVKLVGDYDPKALWNQPVLMRECLAREIRNVLSFYDLDVWPEVRLIVEEHVERPIGGTIVPDLEWLEWLPFEAFLEKNCELVDKSFLGITTGTAVDAGYGSSNRLQFRLEPKEAFLVNAVRLELDEHALARLESKQVCSKGSAVLRLPEVPVREIQGVTEAGSTLDIVLELGNGEDIRLEDIAFTLPVLTKSPVSLFIDLGSSHSKLITLSFPEDLYIGDNADGTLHMRIKSRLERFAASLTDGIKPTAWEPQSTGEFVDEWGLPNYNKAELCRGNAAHIGPWISRAIRAFVEGYAKQGRPVVHVYWSFPEINDVDLCAVGKLVRELCDPYLLLGAVVLSEHEAHRLRFGSVLAEMAKIASSRVDERREAEKKNLGTKAAKNRALSKHKRDKEKYDDTFVLWRWFKTKPTKPNLSRYKSVAVPTLEEWHKVFLEINADRKLTDVVVLDAGGYTLDVYGRVGGKVFGKSLEAGGQSLTEEYRKYLSEKKGSEIGFEQAEQQKIRFFVDERYKLGDTESKFWDDCTSQIYSRTVSELCEWLSKQSKKKGLPVLLTGGASGNWYYLQLVKRSFEKVGLNLVVTGAVDLSQQITRNDLLENGLLRRFATVTHGFDLECRFPSTSHDVVAGLFEHLMSG